MSEHYVYVDTAEQDGSECNHLLRMIVRGKEYLISATAPTALGQEGSRVWVTWSEMECHKVITMEEAPGQFVTGQIFLCTATNVRPM
jgi:hypothetical protein